MKKSLLCLLSACLSLAGRSAPITLTLPALALVAPETVMASSRVEARVECPLPPGTWIYLSKAGSEPGSSLNYFYANSETGGAMAFTAPSETGEYEFPYVSSTGKILARQSLRLTPVAPE